MPWFCRTITSAQIVVKPVGLLVAWLNTLFRENTQISSDFTNCPFKTRHLRLILPLGSIDSGTASNSWQWVKEHRDARAIALDLDDETLNWARVHNVDPLGDMKHRVDLRIQDVRTATRPKADVVQAFNFSSYLFHPLPELLRYFRYVRRSLAPGGIFMVDGYGGWESQQGLLEERSVESSTGTFGYIWDQADFNPIDNLALCHIHFEFKNRKRWKRAFTYHWRIYTPVEICDALEATGFKNIKVFWDLWPLVQLKSWKINLLYKQQREE